ncbi:hypothetical protein I592_00368 [Enterococcus gilvus ATCC BAA-350]|uniref:Transposase n=1 Tax=Enterococcus gilvus ATCC BAA-350 TaxID=1158614 RepID=R2XUJ4_9ENTE|nr:hypothetical protein UKC_03594 [Enterococcus gilvus ATCC BAA-350]EOW81083.1 hypothetical protein I592_00368 [Enterococcus gilvus ATCC BAA-350]
MPRRSFDEAFKTAAVKLIIEDDFSVKEVSNQLDVHASSLYRWVQEYEKFGEGVFPGKGSAFFDAQYEIKKLEQENRYLREELELLKKFQVFLKPNKKSDSNL